MAGLQRRLDSACAERDRLRRELADLKAVVGWIDPEYSAALRDHAELARASIRRDQAGPITGTPDSRPPDYEARAYDDLRKQRVVQRREAAYLRRRLRWLIDRDQDPEDSSERRRAVLPLPNEQTA